jgi:ABC-type nitrate/sulfonate/bicarbonate transport system permease component
MTAVVMDGRERLQAAEVFMSIVTIAAVGLALNKRLRWASGHFTAWKS